MDVRSGDEAILHGELAVEWDEGVVTFNYAIARNFSLVSRCHTQTSDHECVKDWVPRAHPPMMRYQWEQEQSPEHPTSWSKRLLEPSDRRNNPAASNGEIEAPRPLEVVSATRTADVWSSATR